MDREMVTERSDVDDPLVGDFTDELHDTGNDLGMNQSASVNDLCVPVSVLIIDGVRIRHSPHDTFTLGAE